MMTVVQLADWRDSKSYPDTQTLELPPVEFIDSQNWNLASKLPPIESVQVTFEREMKHILNANNEYLLETRKSLFLDSYQNILNDCVVVSRSHSAALISDDTSVGSFRANARVIYFMEIAATACVIVACIVGSIWLFYYGYMVFIFPVASLAILKVMDMRLGHAVSRSDTN